LPENTEFYYIDECGFDEYYSRDYGYAPRGEKVIGKVCGKHFERTSVVAAVFLSALIASFAFKGSMNGDLFEGWFEQIFVPEIRNPDKSVVFIDNASHHRKNAIYDIADEYGFKVMFIPAYSPDLNKPIENKWGTIKNRLRMHTHKFDNFWDALAFAFK
jgi:transposase